VAGGQFLDALPQFLKEVELAVLKPHEIFECRL
jgi:hypothetical protein